jgi:hypothetical protein
MSSRCFAKTSQRHLAKSLCPFLLWIVKQSCKNDKETQINGQIDLAVHYYIKNEDNKEVVTQYFNSAFPPKASASDLLSKFKESLSGLPVWKILQVSMDGPNVNWAFLRQLKGNLLSIDPEATDLLELGCCCGLNVIHGAFQTGHT